MPFVATKEEVKQLLDDLGTNDLELFVDSSGISFRIPKEYVACLTLGTQISFFMASEHPVLFRVECHGIWSAETWIFFRAIRHLYNVNPDVDEAPDVWVLPNELEYLEAMVLCALLSGWDASIVCPQDGTAIWLSNNEWYGIVVREDDVARRARIHPTEGLLW